MNSRRSSLIRPQYSIFHLDWKISRRHYINVKRQVPIWKTNCLALQSNAMPLLSPLVSRYWLLPAFPPVEVSSYHSTVADLLTHQGQEKFLYGYMEQDLDLQHNSPSADEESEEEAVAGAPLSAFVPEPWSYGKMRTEIVERTVFLYSIPKTENGVPYPVTQRLLFSNSLCLKKYNRIETTE